MRFGHDDEVTLKVKPGTPFSKIYAAVAKQQGVEDNTFKLLVDGELLRPDHSTVFAHSQGGILIVLISQRRKWFVCQ